MWKPGSVFEAEGFPKLKNRGQTPISHCQVLISDKPTSEIGCLSPVFQLPTNGFSV